MLQLKKRGAQELRALDYLHKDHQGGVRVYCSIPFIVRALFRALFRAPFRAPFLAPLLAQFRALFREPTRHGKVYANFVGTWNS